MEDGLYLGGIAMDKSMGVLELATGRVAHHRSEECVAWKPLILLSELAEAPWRIYVEAPCFARRDKRWERIFNAALVDTVTMRSAPSGGLVGELSGCSGRYVVQNYQLCGAGGRREVWGNRGPARVGQVLPNGWGVARDHLPHSDYNEENDGNLLFFAGDTGGMPKAFSGSDGLRDFLGTSVDWTERRAAFRAWAKSHAVVGDP